MRRRYWHVGGVAALILLALSFILTGGVYRTVNAGNGIVYVVNRLTAKTWLITPAGKKEVRYPAKRKIRAPST